MGAVFRQRLDGVLARLEHGIAGLLRQGRATGEVAARHDPDVMAQFVVAAWQGAILRMKAAGDPGPMQNARDILLDMLAR